MTEMVDRENMKIGITCYNEETFSVLSATKMLNEKFVFILTKKNAIQSFLDN
ncbi:hypothetical protein [Hydrococcus rivularis]|uniref:hypothetical protein n=1 Tax=Hydrococcus rivularis TaxID=1616834 RepID=UPI000B17CDDA|nr:hypothetical protein [Hydrococcus rivularis]